jgi:hypothetical protein
VADLFSGDPKLYLTENGAAFRYRAGNPVMERGVGNAALISLFTREGWPGNIFLPPAARIGSDFEETARGTLTLSKLADVERAAEIALESKLFPAPRARARNPNSDSLAVEITIGPGGALSLNREGPLWTAQASGSSTAGGNGVV